MTTTPRILLFLRIGLHVLVALLLVIGIVGEWGNAPAVALAVVFALVYVAGTVWHNRGREFSRGVGWAWLALVCALWVGMTLLAPTFVWLLFPLVFLILYLVPLPLGPVLAVVAWAVAVAVTGPAYGVGGFVGPAIGTVLAIVIYYSYEALKRDAEHYRALAATLADTREELAATQHEAGVLEERTRLSREIHDTLAQGFSSIVLLTRAASKSLRIDPQSTAETLQVVEATAKDNLNQARQLVTGEVPASQSLEQRVAELARQAEARQRALGQKFSAQCTVAQGIDGPAADIVERVVREGLSNVVRHSHASQAVVTIEQVGDEITVDVFDNGHGISAEPGYGLRGVRARVEEAGGELAVESSSSGTVLAARLKGNVHD
ncbi:sensor histidine kinase [Corynebacterium lubricantis]|uniref:sensor histidine kinase n=1 Tax=Corynebacterium lubricantis TaxID=541095 RepID=UPI00035E1B93|nr:sensor histidine kinase [Corynebacterium lubricantis]